MIKDVEILIDDEEYERLRKIIVSETFNSGEYLNAVNKLNYAVEEERISEEEDREIKNAFSDLPDENPIFQLARKRAIYHVRVLKLDQLNLARKKIETMKDVIRDSRSFENEKGAYVNWMRDCITQYGPEWYKWDDVTLNKDPDNNYYWVVALYEMRNENATWRSVVDDIERMAMRGL